MCLDFDSLAVVKQAAVIVFIPVEVKQENLPLEGPVERLRYVLAEGVMTAIRRFVGNTAQVLLQVLVGGEFVIGGNDDGSSSCRCQHRCCKCGDGFPAKERHCWHSPVVGEGMVRGKG